jgi:hypothetical protein
MILIDEKTLQRAMELLAVATFHSVENQKTRTDLINEGLAALAEPLQSEHCGHSLRRILTTAVTNALSGMSDTQLLDMMKDSQRELAEAQPAPVQTNFRHCGGPDNVLCAGQCKQAAPPAATVEDNSQNWAGMDGTTAWHLIDRHANGWADIGKMMGEWLAANCTPPAAPAAAPMTEFEEAVAAVDNTLHHAIDHWQDRALKAETKLAQPAQQEPYGWVQPNPSFNSGIFNQGAECPSGWVGSAIDVYTTPPAAAQPEQKSVAWVDVKDTHHGPYEFHGKELLPVGKHDLYTTPPVQPTQQGLADEVIKCFKAAEMACQCSYMDHGRRTVNEQAWQRLMQAVAACAHVIKE